jgi:hypothetical protein
MDARVLFVGFAVLMLLIGFAAAQRYPHLFYKPYKGISILRLVISGLFLLSLTFLIFSVFGVAGGVISGIILFFAGIVAYFDRPDKDIR